MSVRRKQAIRWSCQQLLVNRSACTDGKSDACCHSEGITTYGSMDFIHCPPPHPHIRTSLEVQAHARVCTVMMGVTRCCKAHARCQPVPVMCST